MPRHLPDIDPRRCTGCGRCISACGPHVLVLERQGWDKVSALTDPAACTGCHHCAWHCPFGAITMRRAPLAPADEAPASESAQVR